MWLTQYVRTLVRQVSQWKRETNASHVILPARPAPQPIDNTAYRVSLASISGRHSINAWLIAPIELFCWLKKKFSIVATVQKGVRRARIRPHTAPNVTLGTSSISSHASKRNVHSLIHLWVIPGMCASRREKTANMGMSTTILVNAS